MEKLVRIALAAFFLLGLACAQKIPRIDVFGGYSFLSFDLPASSGLESSNMRLGMKEGWEFSGSVHLFHRFAAEGDVSGHKLGDCGGIVVNGSGLNCSDFSYMGGPRFNFGIGSGRITGFVHGLIGQDRATLLISQTSTTVSDTSVAAAGGGGLDYWITRRIGVQLGPADYLFTRHLNNYQGYNLPNQSNIRISGGVVFRFGGNLPSSTPSPKSRRARSTSQPAAAAAAAPQPAQMAVSVPGRGMAIPALGVLVMPQEFDGAKIVEIVPGGVAEMASMKAGDLIKSVDGKPVKTPMELLAELSDKSGKVRIDILRGEVATETLILLGAH